MTEREPVSYTGHDAVDNHQSKVGRITDVIYDQATATPRWVIVRTTMLPREHIAPIEGSYMADDGRVVLAHDRTTVKHAPTAPHDHVVDPELEAEAVRHYGLAA